MATITQNDQRIVSLAVAQANRLERARLLTEVRGRRLDPTVLVLDPPAALQSMFVFDFLRHIPHVRHARVREINKWAIRDQVNLAVTMGMLSPGRRDWLVRALVRPTLTRRPCLAGRPQG